MPEAYLQETVGGGDSLTKKATRRILAFDERHTHLTIPAHKEVDLAFLLEIVRSSRPERPVEVVSRVPRHFPEMTPEDQALTRQDGRTKLFENMVHWARNRARERGFLKVDVPAGVWEATASARSGLIDELVMRGIARQKAESFVAGQDALPSLLGLDWAASKRDRFAHPPMQREQTPPPPPIVPKSPSKPFVQEVKPAPREVDEVTEIKQALLRRLNALEGYEFEHLVARILDAAGLPDSQITGRSGDEGVDVMTKLVSPFLSATVAVQVKRHTGNVGPKDISYLRDRWARRADKLLFITTSDFTVGAREVADDSPKVALINGIQLVDIMFELGLGLRKKPRLTYEIEEDFFTG